MRRWAGVARFGGIGDNLIAASVFAPLKRMGYLVDVITGEPNHVIYHHNPHVDKLSVKKVERDLPQNDLPGWQKWLDSRACEYDVFLHASHSCEGRHAVFPTMTAFWWPADYRRKLCAGSYLETVHDIIGVPHEFGPLYFTSPEERARAQQVKDRVGGRFVAWIISGTRVDKVYPYMAFAISRVIKELGVAVVMIGGSNAKEFGMAKTIQDQINIQNSTDDRLHLALSPETAEPGGDQSWPIRRSLALAQAADLVVTPDTGAAWAVAFEPVPKVVMLSHASPENITKHWVNTTTLHADPDRVPCWPCHRLHDSIATCVENKQKNGAACISDISVETLVAAVADGLQCKSNNIVHAEHAFPRGKSYG